MLDRIVAGYAGNQAGQIRSRPARVMREARCPVLTVPRGVVRGESPAAEREPASG